MIGASIRARLTAWYVAVLAVATLSLAGASWWLSNQSVIRAADVGLQARVEGVRDFLENPRTRLTIAGLRDEFSEYAELTRGEALLEVIDPSGAVLCRPSIPGWAEMAAREATLADSADVVPHDRMLGRQPFRIASASITAVGRTYRVTVAAPMGPAYDALSRFHRLLLVLVPLVLAIAGVGGYWVSHRALAPVDRMTQAVQALSVRNLDHRLEVPAADDELRRLASTFNHVLARLQAAVNDIVRFTADASHELRTPVSLVRTTAEIALRHERTPQEYRLAFTEVLEHAQHMSALVADLLVLARTDAGIEGRHDTELDLRDIASDTAREFAMLAAKQGIRLSVQLPRDPVILRGDLMSLRRLLTIVLDNAVKYSAGGGTVLLNMTVVPAGTAAGERAARVEVTDSGIGLDPDEVPRLFERFYRGSRARQCAPEGSGLGLAIARTIVERYRGSIALGPGDRDSGPGGCRVEVILPLEREPSREEAGLSSDFAGTRAFSTST